MSLGHLTAHDASLYRNRSLAADELLPMTSHLANCTECRKLVAPEPVAPLVSALEPEHLTFEQLARYAASSRVPDHHVNAHLRSCDMCNAELRDLRAFSRTLPGVEKPGRLSILLPAAAFAVAALAFVAVRSTRTTPTPPVASTPAPPALVASVRDHGRVIGLDAQGRLQGISSLDDANRSALIAALQTGALPALPDLRDVTRSAETQLTGEPAAVTKLAPLGPLGVVVLSDRPLFHWTAIPGATGYRVAVFDVDFNEVAASSSLRSTQWQPPRPLRRANVYIWTVTATVGGENVTAPKAPAPEARFRVASVEAAASVNATGSESDLAFALAAWKGGMKDDARATMRLLTKANPDSAELARLAGAMGARRQP